MKIPTRVASVVINSLKGGVVPRIGLPYITVGRDSEINALLYDAEIMSQGGASFRFIVGKYGSGKSFLLQCYRNFLMDRGFVVADADLSPERRLTGTRGQGLATYRELIRNSAVKTRPEGNALPLILDKWISAVRTEAAKDGGDTDDATEKLITKKSLELCDMIHGYDFAKILVMYYRAFVNDDIELRGKILKWFKGEYNLKSEVKSELGVNIMINDDDWYDYIKLFSAFFYSAGYTGFVILIDELVNIYKIPQTVTRQSNYEKILTMYNDVLQGKAQRLGIIMSGTVQCVEDTRRGVYSYEALRSRLAEGRFSNENVRDMLAPVIKLVPLTPEELLILSEKLSEIHAVLFNYTPTLTRDDLEFFIRAEFGRVGAETHITPREVIRDLIELLDILMQKPDMNIKDILSDGEFQLSGVDGTTDGDDDLFAEFDV
jgi:hypothetical protein